MGPVVFNVGVELEIETCVEDEDVLSGMLDVSDDVSESPLALSDCLLDVSDILDPVSCNCIE